MDNITYHINNQEDNNDNKKSKLNLMKLLSGKNLKIIIILIILIIAIILYIGVGSNSTTTSKSNENKNITYQSTIEYSSIIEKKLENLLGQIDGAGQVKVMVTLDGSPELVYASETDTKTSSNSNSSTTTSSSSPIIVNGSGGANALILKENLPAVKGVIIVSSGADQIKIKLDILNAVSKLLDISTDKISVLKGI